MCNCRACDILLPQSPIHSLPASYGFQHCMQGLGCNDQGSMKSSPISGRAPTAAPAATMTASQGPDSSSTVFHQPHLSADLLLAGMPQCTAPKGNHSRVKGLSEEELKCNIMQFKSCSRIAQAQSSTPRDSHRPLSMIIDHRSSNGMCSFTKSTR